MIDSPDNPLVKKLRSLAGIKGRRETGLFQVEGVRHVSDGLASGRLPSLCLFNRDMLTRVPLGRELLLALERAADGTKMALAEASERALKAAGNTEQPQGVVAAFPLPEWTIPDKTPGSPLVLVCDEIRDPGNLGTLLRSAEAAGVSVVLLSRYCVDAFNPKVVRSGAGAHFRLPLAVALEWNQVAHHLSAMGVPRNRTYCAEGNAQMPYDRVDWTGASALVVSNEAHGPSKGGADLCEQAGSVTVPMEGGTESLNAAVAASVILFEAARQRRNAALERPALEIPRRG